MGQARATVDKFYELFAAGRIADATQLFAPECVTLMPGGALNHAEHEAVAHASRTRSPTRT
jgi:hypothetical protein